MMDFIVAAPSYTARSGGVMVLHELCTALNKIGYRAGLAIITEGSQSNQNYKFGFTSNPDFLDKKGEYYDYFTGKTPSEIDYYIKNSCIIYPDIVKGNPLQGRKFATYVLGKPQYEIISDYIISYSRIYIENPRIVLYKPFISEWMNNNGTHHWSQRILNLTYFGKGPSYSECFLVDGSVLIERDWPRDKRQLAALLRNCKYFYSWDSITATLTDAVLCGAVPVLMQEKQISWLELNDGELGSLPRTRFNFSNYQVESEGNHIVDEALKKMENTVFSLENNWLNQVKILANDLQKLDYKLDNF
jgi:hypothetical protein